MSKQDKQSLINAVTDLAIELGRTPTRMEFETSIKGGDWHIKTKFGNYTALCLAAGLDPSPPGARKKLSNDIFNRNIEEVVSQYKPRKVVPKVPLTKTLVIGDTHFPFVCQRVLDAIYEFAKENKPDRIIQVGDLYDMYAHSKFPRSHNIYKPKEEEDLGRKGAEKMWATLIKICPDAECVQLKGNHDIRPLKRTLENLPSLEHVVSKYLDELMTFPGVKLIEDDRQEYIVDGIQFIHGYRTKLGAHRDFTLMNTVCGHMHKGGVVYRRLHGQTLWELNAGLVGDPESKALAYTSQKIYDATPGFGWIDAHGPRFVAL